MVASIVLFDGQCNFCSGWVKFILKRDPKGQFHYASLQSDVARQLLAERGQDQPKLDSILLIEGEQVYSESTAVLRILKGLTGFWKALYALMIVPKPLRDFFYRRFAKHRYQWFGQSESCLYPSRDVRTRFLEITS